MPKLIVLPKWLVFTFVVSLIATWVIGAVLTWQIQADRLPHDRLVWGGSPLTVDDSNEQYSGWLVSRGERVGAIRITSTWRDEGVMWGLGGGWPTDPPKPLVPSWAVFATPSVHTPSRATHNCVAVAGGWPLLAVYGVMHVEHAQGPLTLDQSDNTDYPPAMDTCWARVSDGNLAIKDLNSWQDVIVLPYGILTIGSVANSLIYCLVLAAPITLWKRVRSRRLSAEQTHPRGAADPP